MFGELQNLAKESLRLIATTEFLADVGNVLKTFLTFKGAGLSCLALIGWLWL